MSYSRQINLADREQLTAKQQSIYEYEEMLDVYEVVEYFKFKMSIFDL